MRVPPWVTTVVVVVACVAVIGGACWLWLVTYPKPRLPTFATVQAATYTQTGASRS